MASFAPRRIVTGVDPSGQAVFVSDGPPPRVVESPTGTAVADLWNLFAPPGDPADGGDPQSGGFELEPKPGGMWWRLIRLPLPDRSLPREEQFLTNRADERFSKHRPGMHATNSIDLMIVLDGEIELELDEGATVVRAGDTVVQRGTEHRWRVIGDGPCTYLTAMFAVDPSATAPRVDLWPQPSAAPTGSGPRRIVTGIGPGGQSMIVTDGEAPSTLVFDGGAGMMYSNLWETGGAIAHPLQGGDTPEPYIQLDPIGMGVSWKYLEIPCEAARATIDGVHLRADMAARGRGMSSTGHHDPDDPGNHRTDTIDLDLILEGDVELELPGHGSVRLGAGDFVVQRGNWHKWHNRGDTPMRMIAILIGAPIAGREQ